MVTKNLEKKVRKFGKLKEKIKEQYNSQKLFAEALGINGATLNLKLNGKGVWTLAEIETSCNLLGITKDEIKDYFFY